MDELAEAVIKGTTRDELHQRRVAPTYLAAHLRRDDIDILDSFDGRDVRRSLNVGAFPMPELAPDEVLVVVRASAIDMGRVFPALSSVYPLERVGEAARLVQTNQHVEKVGELCPLPRRGWV